MLSSPSLGLDTFLVAVYCVVDDLYRAELAGAKPTRPGHRPELSDSEVLTLALLAQWQQGRSERAFLRYAQHHWRAYFPRLLTQSAFNRRAGPERRPRPSGPAGQPARGALGSRR